VDSRPKLCPPCLGKLLEEVGGLGEYVYGDSRDGVVLRREYGPSRPEEVACNILDALEFQRATGWSPEVDIKTGLERTYEWFKASR